ncbi:sn-glycerol-3-phosphate ABC transporter ATP-binding protein UgpC [Kiloniella laminariae]|uniref:Sn-glycerol-3-phosphate ABC transporter ATP-binding protein UgpC n=1 Tax=Kiloniella laminariae TaxID=454162 RepID=A0ABT4LLY5_9PROT|nr:sn-glycerol-3-phosphate ABC transporter ATP-binding protein UgpC [Kiloniella laminariae]MCZ4282114.1 sn-glycerol-3-phosphate ABC transporter ATP-binding protein UgpC [Kiloniella laminariae]
MADIKLTDIRKAYGKNEVLRDINIDIKDGEFVVFVGPSGCGKSTLLRMIAGLEDISGGSLQIAGETVNDLTPSQRKIAMVFQSYALYPHMTVYQNMAFGLTLGKKGPLGGLLGGGENKKIIEEKVQKAAVSLKLEQLLKRYPRELSGGQRQRVAIGRAIVRDPNVFLFDEPLSNLDAALRVNTRLEIAKLHQDLQATIIYVTHDQVEAMTLADKIVVLNDGHVAQYGTPLELYHHPANKFVAGFIGSPAMNFVSGTVVGKQEKALEITLDQNKTTVQVPVMPGKTEAGDVVTLGIRPEHMSENQNGDFTISSRVLAVERLGDASYLYLENKNHAHICVKVDGHSATRTGDQVLATAPLEALHVFDAGGQALQRSKISQKHSASA